MDKKKYSEYLGSLVDNFEIEIENEDFSELFYSYFQCFMPEGKNIEKVFEPIENSEPLLHRILKIYEVTKEKTLKQFSEGFTPGYFCPNPTENVELLKDLGNQHIENLKLFSLFMEDNELEEMLNEVNEIAVLDKEIELEDDYLNSYLYDTISDWGMENENEGNLNSILSEAYYSINCDYYLSYYLQYPSFEKKPEQDFLKSYYEIWKNGHYCKFDKNKLIIYK